MRKLRTLMIADDHFLIRAGVKEILGDLDGTLLVAEANTGKQTLELFELHRPDILLLDISFPDMNGLEVTQRILQLNPEARVIIVSMHKEAEYISKAMEVGVRGYVIKNESGEELQNAVKAVLDDKQFFSREVQEVVFRAYTNNLSRKHQAEEQAITITGREKEILRHLANGLTSPQIASILFISSRTVETHRSNLMKKLDANNVVDLLNKVQQKKLLGSESA